MVGETDIRRLAMRSESNRHGLYPSNELEGISPAFILKPNFLLM